MLKWGIVGPGKIAHNFVKDLALVEGVELTAIASRSYDKARDFADQYGANKAYGSYDEIFQDKDVDILYIATPHNSHCDLSIKAMNAGKHVLCEKPLAVNKKEVRQMINASRKNNVFLMEAFWSKFNPSIVEILKLVEGGEIGKVNYLNADFTFYKEVDDSSRMFNMDLAGGSLLDVGVYPIFLAYAVFGMPKDILATSRFHNTGADVQTAIILKYDEGIASLMCGFRSQSEVNAKICGTGGSIIIDSRWHETQGFTKNVNGITTHHSYPTTGKGYSHEIEACKKSISENRIENPDWSHQNSLDLITICDKIREQVGLKYPFET